ncbi:hypothetical protein CHUAL_010289 [Chamberlinius hualienensis]
MSKLNQAELRRLMKEKQKQLSKEKKIDSPLAKYVDGQLVCIVCDSPVKTEALWPAHVNGRIHKQNVETLKNPKKPPQHTDEQPAQPTVFKRPPTPPKSTKRKPIDPDENPVEEKRLKSSNDSSSVGINNKQSLRELCNTLEDNETDDDVQLSKTQLPTDFFDNQMEVDNDSKDSQKDKALANSDLPEGFFDNPVIDAKVRKVEYKDPTDVEWEKFQREIADVSNKSQAIITEEEEESHVERQIEEVDEQISYWTRVTTLQQKKDDLKAIVENVSMNEQLSDESGDEQDFEEYLDWRKKDSRR